MLQRNWFSNSLDRFNKIWSDTELEIGDSFQFHWRVWRCVPEPAFEAHSKTEAEKTKSLKRWKKKSTYIK
jgi:hypothetical protein